MHSQSQEVDDGPSILQRPNINHVIPHQGLSLLGRVAVGRLGAGVGLGPLQQSLSLQPVCRVASVVAPTDGGRGIVERLEGENRVMVSMKGYAVMKLSLSRGADVVSRSSKNSGNGSAIKLVSTLSRIGR